MAADYEIEVAEWEAILQRDEEAFARWLSRSEIRLRASLRTFAPAVDVEAIVQEAGLTVWSMAHTIEPDGRPEFLLRYARTVAYRKAVTEWRRASIWGSLPDLDDLPDPHARRPDILLRRQIQDCVDRLEAKLRETLRGRMDDQGERPDRKLAQDLGIAFDAFRKRVQRAREAMRKCLRSAGIDVAEYVR